MTAGSVLPVLLLWSLTAWGQEGGVVQLPGPPPLTLPGWLTPFPQAREMTAKATSTEAKSAYTAKELPAVVADHYAKQMRAAGIDFAKRQDGLETTIEAQTDRDFCVVHIREDGGDARVEVIYSLGRNPAAAAVPEPENRVAPALRLEWPRWLGIEGAQPVSQRTNPPGRAGKAWVEACPGDVIGKPSRGCLHRVYESSSAVRDVFAYFESILENHGYTAERAGMDAYGDPQLWKKVGDIYATLRMREYPDPQQPDYYRQVEMYLRHPQALGNTKVEITFLVHNPPGVEPAAKISGTWAFTHGDGRFQGLVMLKESEWGVTGTWRTTKGKVEPDDQVICQVDGHTVQLIRLIGSQFRQDYVLELSVDGNRLDGFGDGFFLNHTNLNMQRVR